MGDIIKSIKAYLYDRAASPLIGAYITAWSIWNYRVFIIIFTDAVDFKEVVAFFKNYAAT